MSAKKQSKLIEQTEIENLGTVKVGRQVSHPVFGNGIVLKIAEWEDGEITLNVIFDKAGSKWLVPELAGLLDQKPINFLKPLKSLLTKLSR
ncbi:hypothetical protein EYS14_18775 [Alteromonadaceae bacterium M269]|nr:hypothetical protein EYS14_18775 [Alteromonadaceae bacterium M269]